MKAELILSCDAKGNLKTYLPKPPETERRNYSSLTSLKTEGLILEESIIRVHDDLDPWGGMSVGFDGGRQLVIEMTYDSYGSRSSQREHYRKRIVIPSKDTGKLIDKLETSLTKLPSDFADEFAYYNLDEESWNVREVFDIFNEILNYLSCLNIRYKIEKEWL